MKNKQTIGSLLLLFTAMIWGAASAAQRAARGVRGEAEAVEDVN